MQITVERLKARCNERVLLRGMDSNINKEEEEEEDSPEDFERI
jgi:hypothetical protein